MKILITGNRGFIGSHLYEYLEEKGHQVIGIDNNFHPCKKASKGIIGDIRNKQLIDEYVKKVDIVFHLAAIIHVDYSIKYPYETLDVNCNGTLNVLDAVTKYNKRMIFASTSEVYGTDQSRKAIIAKDGSLVHIDCKMDEDHNLDCCSPYGATKVFGDRLCKSYYDTYKTKVTILRNFNTFGEWQNDGSYGGVIAIFTRKALAGDDITIFGDGEQERDYMYVSDAVKGYELCIRKELIGEVLNVGSGRVVTVNEIARLIKDITKSKSKIVHVKPRPGEVQRLCANTLKAQSFGFKGSTNFERDLAKYISFYKKEIFNN